jgi:hypothetical protein
MRALLLCSLLPLLAPGCDTPPPADADAAVDGDASNDGGQCPAEPFSQESCIPDTRCDYGTETCCGQSYPAINCLCTTGGQWTCMYTDACLIPSCEEVVCGDDVCDVNEYCVNQCLCCGIPDAGPPQTQSECRPLPESCDPASFCECEGIAGTGACDPDSRTIDIPCA